MFMQGLKEKVGTRGMFKLVTEVSLVQVQLLCIRISTGIMVGPAEMFSKYSDSDLVLANFILSS